MELRICPRCQRIFREELQCPECSGSLVVATPDFFIGKSFGKYTLEAILGMGGMGVVYRAEQETLQRKVAIKLILPGKDDEKYRRRFLREARLAAGIRHPNVVEIYDFDVNEMGLPFYVMEYLEGRTLRQLLRDRGALTPAEVIRILEQVGAGLAAAHRQGVVHRDLKPENVFLARYEGEVQVKLLDFGIAKPLEIADEETLTRTGMVMGTIDYVAPEQVLEGPISPATDQYALALMVVEMLTGRRVRDGKSPATVIAREMTAPASVPALASSFPALEKVIARATMPNAEDRFPDLSSFVEAVVAPLAEPPDEDRETSDGTATKVLESAPHAASRRGSGRAWLVGAAVVAGLAVATTVLVGRGSGPRSGPGLLAQLREIPVPVDARRIVASSGEALAVAGTNGLGLVALGEQRPTGRVDADLEDVLVGTSGGELVLRNGDRIEVLGLDGSERLTLAEGVPAKARVLSSPDSRWLVVPDGQRLSLWQRQGRRIERRRAFDPGFVPGKVTVGDHLLAAAGPEGLAVWSLPSGKPVYRGPPREHGIVSLTVDDISGLVAVGGWFDTVYLVDPKSGSVQRMARRPGATQQLDLQFVHLARGTMLAVGEPGGITLWDTHGNVVARWDRPQAVIEDLDLGLGGLLALDTSSHTVCLLSLGGIRPARTVRFGGEDPWALVSDAGSKRVLVGDRSGALFAIPIENGKVQRFDVHTQGITSLVSDGKHLASASDDRTIAVWRLPSLKVEWRTRAHGFLINSLVLSPGGKILWSASSDGRLKRWSWPDLREQETIDVSSLLGQRVALHACWLGPDARHVLVGTWNRKLVELRRETQGWRAKAIPFPSWAGYQLLDLGTVRAVLVVGVGHPAELALYDLEHDALLPLRRPGGTVNCAAALDRGRRVLAFSNDEILDYRIRRGPGGRLRYRLAVIRCSGLGQALAAAPLPNGRVAVACETGVLGILDTSTIRGTELCDLPAGQ